MQVRLQMAPYRLQAVVQAPTVANVNHVVLAVYRNGAVVPGATRKVAVTALKEPLVLSHLRLATTYEIRATAYADAAATVPLSDATLSRCTFTTPAVTTVGGVARVDATPIAVTVPVKLKDAVYNGKAPITITATRIGVRQVQLTLFRDEAIVSQTSYEVAAIPATLTVTLGNLKPGVGTYRVQADGINPGNRVLVTTSAPLSTLPVGGILNDALAPIALTLN